jgi:molecular chaperone HscA
VATGGDTALGGDDIDRVLAAKLLDAAGVARDPSLLRRALDEARAAKHRLSDSDATEMVLGPVAVPPSRADLAKAMRPWLDKTGRAVRRALRDAELSADELDGVILVGGSTKSPVVRNFVAELFGREPLSQLDPEEVVALGAAAQAHALTGGSDEVVLLDVIPLSLGIETMGGVVEKVVPRNSTIPARAVQTFTTYADNQTGFDIHVVQGERETVDGNRSLARFQLKGLPAMPAGLARVEIRFEVDADGLTRVTARELVTGAEAAVEVKPTYGLTDEEVERMLVDSFEHAEQDLARRSLLSERVEAEQLLVMTRSALERDGELCDEPARAAIERAAGELETVIRGEDHRAIRQACEALDRAAHPFAEARMNRAVREAVRGRRLDEVDSSLGGRTC